MIRELLVTTLLVMAIYIVTSPTTVQAACYINGETGESICDVYTQWKSDGINTAVSWAPDCAIDIEGNDLKTAPNVSDKLKCGELCFKDEKCTHFTFTKVSGSAGRCAMKAKVRGTGQQPKKSPGAFCGYINTRTDFAWVGK